MDVWRRAQLLARPRDIWENAEGVVGFENCLEVVFGEGKSVLGEGVFEGLDCYVGEVFILTWGGWLA